MYTQTYTSPRTYLKYNKDSYMVYLNEVIVPDYVEPHFYEGEEGYEPTPVTGYQYTGTERDGGTIINCTSATRNEMINGIIRAKYSQSEEDAIKTHQIQVIRGEAGDKADDYDEEWAEFDSYRMNTIALVDRWLSE